MSEVPGGGDFDRQPDEFNDDAVIQSFFQAEEARNRRILRRVGLPLAVVTVALAGLDVYIDPPFEKPAEKTLSCDNFSESVLQPPIEQFGFSQPGFLFNGKQITISGMKVNNDYVNADGSPIHDEPLGEIKRQNNKLEGNTTLLPTDVVAGIVDILQISSVRFGVCNLDGGLKLEGTDAAAASNGEYQSDIDSAEIIMTAGIEEPLYKSERDLGYVLTHEYGHAVRNKILTTNTDTESVKLIHQMDDLYTKQMTMATEEYRLQNGPELAKDLDAIYARYKEIDAYYASDSTKHKVKLAIDYIKQRLTTPGGLSELAISKPNYDPGNSEPASLLSANSMIARASIATVGDKEAIYGLDEAFIDSNDRVGQKLLSAPDAKLTQFLQSRFLSEHAMPGDTGGHTQDDSNELFASGWAITGLTSQNHFEEVAANVPDNYRAIVIQELQTVWLLRKQLDPVTLTH